MSLSMRAWTLVCVTVLGTFAAGRAIYAQARNAEEAAQQKGVDVLITVDGGTTTIVINRDGSAAKKSETDSERQQSILKARLANQEIVTKGAEAAFRNAKLTHEVAEIAVVEYDQGFSKQDLKTLEGEIALAESDLVRAKDRLEWAKHMFDKGYVGKAQVVSEELSLQRSNFAQEQAQMKKAVLVNYTKGKIIKELTSEVDKTRADELAKQATWELEKSKEAKLRQQVEHGQVTPESGRSGASRPAEVETVIRAGKVLIRVLPDGQP